MNKNRLLWASRRGMLELDLILQPFVENTYDSLCEDDQLRFEALLEREDQQLFVWLMKRELPTDPDTQRIVQIIHDQHGKSAWNNVEPLSNSGDGSVRVSVCCINDEYYVAGATMGKALIAAGSASNRCKMVEPMAWNHTWGINLSSINWWLHYRR